MNNLSGELPQEFCCMPCLATIHMANNKIGGGILTCLAEVPTLNEIDFAGNDFTQLTNAASEKIAIP
jgi:hypothetical protein